MWVDVIRDPHNTVDRFATSGNRQTERFNSKFWDVGTETTDALTVNWADENNWWYPPTTLVCRLLCHAKICHCSGTLVVPAWKSSPFWPILCPDGNGFALFVQGVVVLPI